MTQDRKRLVIVGSAGGLGSKVASRLMASFDIYGINHQGKGGLFDFFPFVGDIGNELTMREFAENVIKTKKIDGIIHCAGKNFIKSIPDLNGSDLLDLMHVNAFSIFYIVKPLLENLRGGFVCNVVSNAASVPMTNSLAYNASKAAARMMTKQMARELIKSHQITSFSVSPNKLKGTGMSDYIDNEVCRTRGWSLEEARAYQAASLPAGVETDPEACAEFIAHLCSEKENWRYLNGCDLTYGGPNQ